VHIAVENSDHLCKSSHLTKFSTFPQALFRVTCGNVENF
jgi:hypothetical protein